LLDEEIDQSTAFGWNFGQPGDATTRASSLGIDTGKPWDESAPEKN
jgi:hypothetical protein